MGNQAVQRLLESPPIQAKLKVNQAGDQFEREADRTADTVMRAPADVEPGSLPLSISRMPDDATPRAEEEDNAIQRASRGPLKQNSQSDQEEVRSARGPLLQREDAEEESLQRQEAGAEEESVQRRETTDEKEKVQRRETTGGEEKVQRRESGTDEENLQRREAGAEEDEAAIMQRQEQEDEAQTAQRVESSDDSTEDEEAVMTTRSTRETPAVPPGFAAKMRQSNGDGRPVPEETRTFFEERFGADFGSVKIHTGTEATKLNRAIHAKAFTRANHIYFSDGAYDPSSSGGKTLLAHELTHVVQQGHAPPSAGANAPAGSPVQGGGVLQRQEADEDEDRPTEEQRAAALAAAQRAAKLAERAASVGKGEVAKLKQEKAEQKEAEQTAKQEARAAGGQAKESEAKVKKRKKKGGAMMPQVLAEEQEAEGAGAGGEKKAPASPEEDPAFQKVVMKIGGVAKKQKAHATPQSKAAEAQAGAEAPVEEVTGRAENIHAGEMEKTETPPFDAAGFKAQLLKRIEELAPKTQEEADDFKDSGKLEGVKEQMGGTVAEGKAASRGPLEKKKDEAPDIKKVEPKPVTPIPEPAPGARPPGVGANEAAPKSKTEAEVEAPIQENSKQVGDELSKENITEEQLAQSNEPQFQEALASKRDAETHAAESPQAYRQFEQGQLGQAEEQAAATAAARTKGMHTGRTEAFGQVHEMQGQTKSKDEIARLEVGQHINGIYEKSKTEVERILTELDGKVEKAFDEGAAGARKTFEDYVDARMEAYKEERYGGWFGWARWAKDKIGGMPDEVNEFYVQGRNLYLREMDAVLDTVVAIIAAELTAAKAEIARGRKEITDYLAGLEPSLQTVGAEAAEQASMLFDTLEENVNNKQGELIDKLASKYNEHLKAVDARIEELQAENRGLVAKAIDAVKGVINTIIELKNMLFRVLAKIAEVVMEIISDPIDFLGKMIDAVKQGLDSFIGNIEEHLKAGFIMWLTGALGSTRLQMPDDVFSLSGMFSLITQVLGLTWDYVRGKAVKLLGEPVVKTLEGTFEVFQILMTEGPAGLWEYAKEQFSDLKEMVVEQIKSMLITQVIKAGVKWILSLLNPVAAFIKAAIAIYDIVSFFVQRAKQIMELIEAFVDAVAAVAKGGIATAAKLIENAFAKAIPLIIGLLASLLGISGLADRVQNLFKSLRKRVDKFIDGLLLKAKGFARKFVGKLSPDKRGKVVDEKEQKNHETIGKAVAKEMAKPPTEAIAYDSLRMQKEKQAQSLIGKYGKQLKPPVKLMIEFRSSQKDKEDGDLDFKVRIAPNDFLIEEAVEGKAGGIAPKVGTYAELRKEEAGDKEAHHVPPKGLLGWIQGQAFETAQKNKKELKDNPWLAKLSSIEEAAFDPGNPIAAITIDKHTHIKKTGNPKEEAYRAHWGEGTAQEIMKRLKDKKLRLIYRSRFDELDAEDKKHFKELANEAGEDPGALSAEEEKLLAEKGGAVLSTQFFKTELNTALKEEQAIKEKDMDGLRRSLGRVAKGAYMQSREAVTVALEKSDRDGTKEERKSALGKLDSKSEETWKQQPGISEIDMF